MNCRKIVFSVAALAAASASAEFKDGPKGIRINDRVILKPYVAFSYTYDSNVDSGKHGKGTSSWSVSPGVSTSLKGDRWTGSLSAVYTYHAYQSYSKRLNSSSYSLSGSYGWTTGGDNERGWSFVAAGTYSQTSQDDDMTESNGRGIGRDRKTANATAGVEHRFSPRLHAGANLSFNYIDFDNNVDKYATMYGWQLCTIGANAGYVLNPWTDITLSSSFQGYWQDNHKKSNGYSSDATGRGKSRSARSKGWTTHLGISTRATERLRYNFSGGWTHFDYGGSAQAKDSFTYSLSGHYKVSDSMSVMWLGSSYYQPSEREVNASSKNYTMSMGVAKSLVRGRMSGNFNLSYRHQENSSYEYKASDYSDDTLTARIGLSYTVNPYCALFGNVEYQTNMTKGNSVKNNEYDYDRWRATVGFRLTY